jgi:hypothetical protein
LNHAKKYNFWKYKLDTFKILSFLLGLSGLILGIRAELRHIRNQRKMEIGDLGELKAYYWMICNDAFLVSKSIDDTNNIYDKVLLENIIAVVEKRLPLAMRIPHIPPPLIDLNRIRGGARRAIIYSQNSPNYSKDLYFGLAKFYTGVSSIYINSLRTEHVIDKGIYDNEFEKRSEYFDKAYWSLPDNTANP